MYIVCEEEKIKAIMDSLGLKVLQNLRRIYHPEIWCLMPGIVKSSKPDIHFFRVLGTDQGVEKFIKDFDGRIVESPA